MESRHARGGLWAVGLNLMLVCLVAGLVIAATYAITAPVAAQQREMAKKAAMLELLPSAQDFIPVGDQPGWYQGVKDGQTVGYVLPAEGKGYGGAIKMLVGVTPDGKVLDYKILSHFETPGLGDKAAESKFRRQFREKAPADLVVVKSPTDQNIQALTGATITSRAVTTAVRTAVEELNTYLAGQKGR